MNKSCHLLTSLLALLFFLSGPAMKGNAEIWHSTIAAKTPLLSTTSGEAMESGLFQRIQTAFQRNGGVMQADAESTRLLQSLGAEGATLDSSTILLRQNPGTSAVYEELIHSAQLRRGMTDATRMEIEAAEKLIRFRQGYGIPNAETRQTIERLRQLRGGQ